MTSAFPYTYLPTYMYIYVFSNKIRPKLEGACFIERNYTLFLFHFYRKKIQSHELNRSVKLFLLVHFFLHTQRKVFLSFAHVRIWPPPTTHPVSNHQHLPTPTHPLLCWRNTWMVPEVNLPKNGCHALENLRCFCHPEKNRVDFAGYPLNHFSGCRLNGWLYVEVCMNYDGYGNQDCPQRAMIFAVQQFI